MSPSSNAATPVTNAIDNVYVKSTNLKKIKLADGAVYPEVFMGVRLVMVHHGTWILEGWDCVVVRHLSLDTARSYGCVEKNEERHSTKITK